MGSQRELRHALTGSRQRRREFMRVVEDLPSAEMAQLLPTSLAKPKVALKSTYMLRWDKLGSQ
jgi:hypothetical protein